MEQADSDQQRMKELEQATSELVAANAARQHRTITGKDVILVVLIVFASVIGVPAMWLVADWSIKTKVLVTIGAAIPALFLLLYFYYLSNLLEIASLLSQ